jgi:mRNA degradation ribonuclease J1/J2
MIEVIKPQKLIPVHTEYPATFSQIISHDVELVLPELGRTITV